MLKNIKVRHLNLAACFILSFFNFIECLSKKYNIEMYFIYVLPFIIVFIVCFFIKSLRMDAYVFGAASILAIFGGTWGNLTGVLFLCFSIYCFKNDKLVLSVITLTFISIVIKFIFIRQGTINEAVAYILGYAYFIVIYYKLMHPKELFSCEQLKEDDINVNIIQMLIEGNRIKKIADKVFLTHNAVTKRINTMRTKYKCGNNEQMIFNFMKSGYIRHK